MDRKGNSHRSDKRAAPAPAAKGAERVAKVIARAGLCSRREAEAWITEGRVAVNGAAIASPALNIGPRDAVTVDGKPLPQRERTRLFLFHKPRGLVTTTSDPEGRPTIFGALPKDLPRLISVGRLDFNTEGLLLLTNDGGLARVLEFVDNGLRGTEGVESHQMDRTSLGDLAKQVEAPLEDSTCRRIRNKVRKPEDPHRTPHSEW